MSNVSAQHRIAVPARPVVAGPRCLRPPTRASAPVRVGFVTSGMGIGGAERLLAELISRIDRTRFEPVLVCLKSLGLLGEQLAERGVRTHAELTRSCADPRIAGRLSGLFRSENLQVVCTVGTGGAHTFWGRLAACMARVPVIVSCPHAMGVPDRYEPPNRLLGGITDAYVAVAHLQKSYLAREEGLPANRICVIPNGVVLTQFRPGLIDRAIRRTLGIPADSPVAGVVACLRPEKNLGLFLEASTRVRRQLPRVQFVIVGDGPEREKLQSRASQLGLDGVVHFAGLRANVSDWVRAMNLVVLTSLCEAFPVSLLEAMACGRPVVATNVGAIPEMLVPGETGVLIPSGDASALAEAMGQLLADPAQAQRMGTRSRRRVEACFDVNSMVREYEQLFAQLLARKQHVRRHRGAATTGCCRLNNQCSHAVGPVVWK